MGLLSYLRGDDLAQKALTGTPAVLEVLNSRRFNGYRPLGGTNLNRDRINGVYVAMQNSTLGAIYNLTPVVRKVIEYQAAQVSQLGLKLYERVDDDDRRQVGDHPAARSMRRPNPWTPGKKFIRGFVTSFLVYGNAYAVKFPENDGFQLVEVSPSWVGIVGESHYQVDAYRIWRANGEYFDVAPNRLVHWRAEDPDDPRRGTSKLETAREELAADVAARQANTELHRSGLALPGWIERPMEAPLITEEGLKRLRESLAAQAKASRREYPILEEGMTFHQGGVTPEDAELLAARRWTSEEIAALYGMWNVPPRTDEERRQFYSDVLPDLTGQLADFLTLQILREDYGLEDHYYEFSLDDKLMGDERIKTLTSAAGAPIMLRDEARAKLNLPALPDGQGEEIIVPANVTEGEGKPSIGVMPIQDPNKPSQDGDFRSGEAEEPEPAGSKASLNGKGLAPVMEVLERFFERQERSVRSAPRKFNRERWSKELLAALDDVLDLSGEEKVEQIQRLKDLGVPQEILWERAGLTKKEIDRARVLQMAEELELKDPDAEQRQIYVNVAAPPAPNVEISEGAIQSHTNVEAPPPAQISMEAPQVNVAPAEVKFAKGAFEAPQVSVEAAPAPNVQVEAPHVEVQAPPAPEVNINEGALQVHPAPITVEAPEAPSVNVSVEQPPKTTKRVIRDANGHIKEIVEEGRKQTVTRDNKNRIESIEEE